jgi:catechol 2,3-dioxygenase-like lactoylglutathione lyase family enzyme
MTSPSLAYVALSVREPEAVADRLADTLGLPRGALDVGSGAVPLLAVGATALAFFDPGHPALSRDRAGLDHLAVAAEDPAAAAAASGLPRDPAAPAARIDGTPVVSIDPSATGGIGLRYARRPAYPAGRSARVERIDHIGVASASNREAETVLLERVGCTVESRQTDLEVRMAVESFTSDRYGVVYHSRPPEPVGGLRVSFLTLGDGELELLEPFDPDPDRREAGPVGAGPGNTRGDRAAIGHFIERRGAGLHHLALKTADIDALLAHCAREGLEVIDAVGRPGSRRARIGFIHPRALGGLLLHFVERDAPA